MRAVSNVLTKNGVGSTTTAANIGGPATDAGVSVLLMSLDLQIILSSTLELDERTSADVHERLAPSSRRLQQ